MGLLESGFPFFLLESVLENEALGVNLSIEQEETQCYVHKSDE